MSRQNKQARKIQIRKAVTAAHRKACNMTATKRTEQLHSQRINSAGSGTNKLTSINKGRSDVGRYPPKGEKFAVVK